MESKTIMLINSDDIDTFICEDINDTLTACGGDVTFRKLKNSGIPPTTKLLLLLLYIANVTILKKR